MLKLKINSRSTKFNTKLLKPKPSLYGDFWKNGILNRKASNQLIEIAKDIIKSMELEVSPKDIIITGSIASYNWHNLSDIDLHVVLDFSEIDDNFNLVKNMLDLSLIHI